MRTEQLKYLVDVAETKSMSKTAEKMFVSPQAVSQSIRQLETELDIELFVRNSQGVSLTKLGEGIVEKAKAMLREEQAMSQMIAESKEKSVDDSTLQIRICSTSAVPNMVLPSVLADMKHKGVDVVPRISMVDSLQELLDDVQSGTYDVGLITYNAEALFRQFAKYQVELDMNLLAEDELVVVMDKRLHQPGQSVLSGEEYQKHFRTMYSMTPVKAMEADSKDAMVIRSNDAEFHRAMMKKADAYVIMPRLAYQQFFSTKSYAALTLEDTKTILLHAAVFRKDLSEELQQFVDSIRLQMNA